MKIVCEVCGLEGEGAPKLFERIDCPQCNAGYIVWEPTPGMRELKCVVRPIYEDELDAAREKGRET